MAISLSTEALPLLFELDACPVIGVSGRTVQFLNAAARAYFPDAAPGCAIRRLLPGHVALHQASAFIGTASVRGAVHVVTVTTMPGLRLFRLEPVRGGTAFPEILVPDELFSMELGLASSFFSAHAARQEDLSVCHYAAHLARTSEQLRRWIQNATLLQALRRDEVPRSDRPVDCAAAIAAIAETAESMLARRGLRLSLTLPESPCSVTAGAALLESLALNLLSNAAKSCGDGGAISISLMRGTHDVHLTVHDNGAGFAEGVLPEIFRAWREGVLPCTDTPHRGYGLPVCLAIADAVNGALVIENSRGQGASVHVFLPLSRSTRTILHSPESAEALAARCRIGLSDALTDEDYLN